MSVYTTITEPQLQTFLQDYDLGQLVEFEGISEGIENTNYFVTTDNGEYVLTIFETLTKKELPFYIELMAFLNEHNIPSAHPVKNRQHSYLGELNNKPAILMQRLHGKSVENPTIDQCASIGSVLADLHLRGKTFSMVHNNTRGTHWRNATGKQLLPRLSDEDAALMKHELETYATQRLNDLPRGVIHADLFRDNVLFDGDCLTGLLDFYNACNDSFLYDIAITVNDWCVTDSWELDFERTRAFCQYYQMERKLSTAELNAWPLMLRIAAMRFWLSRLLSQFNPIRGELTFQKNPDEFKNIIQSHLRKSNQLREVW